MASCTAQTIRRLTGELKWRKKGPIARQDESETSFFRRIPLRYHTKLGLENCYRTVAAFVLTGVALSPIRRSLKSSYILYLYLYLRRKQPCVNEAGLNQGSSDKTDDSRLLDPTLRCTKLEIIENERYQGNGRNIFRDEAEPVSTGHALAPLPILATPAPVAAVARIALRFFGFVSMPAVPRKGFFGDGDDVFVVSEGQIVDRRYRILRIYGNSVEVEDLLEQSRHTLSLPG